uniref:Uncharacterized protein n=1 Tax=Anguilla anguilla TaxID=7936 RepID=A0A0E9VF63_ANGAN
MIEISEMYDKNACFTWNLSGQHRAKQSGVNMCRLLSELTYQ